METFPKLVRIPDESGQPEGRVLVEYSSDRSISRVDPSILGTLPSSLNPSVVWSVRTIRDICQEEIGKDIARRCLDELKAVAGSSKAGFLSILQRELQESQATTPHLQTNATEPHTTQPSDTSSLDTTRGDQSVSAEPTRIHSAPANVLASPVNMNENIFNPPQGPENDRGTCRSE